MKPISRGKYFCLMHVKEDVEYFLDRIEPLVRLLYPAAEFEKVGDLIQGHLAKASEP